jgi:alginate O-acetyltransferase complex protein AlgI
MKGPSKWVRPKAPSQIVENSSYPYVSRALTEFWRRWHISLSTWFRDYLHIPHGGNRHGSARRIYFRF